MKTIPQHPFESPQPALDVRQLAYPSLLARLPERIAFPYPNVDVRGQFQPQHLIQSPCLCLPGLILSERLFSQFG